MALEINGDFFEDQMNVLSALASMDSELGERLRECIARELKGARDRIAASIKFANGDPRGSARAVKRYVARKYLGGVVSILDGKTHGAGGSTYEPPRKVYPGPGGQRGGNRMLRSQRTQDFMTKYAGVDRGFILRFVNSGTNPRYAAGRNGKWSNSGNKTFERLQEEGTWYRGSISARNFFGTAGAREMRAAVDSLAKVIEEEFNRMFTHP